jgi:hypothetical protein
MMVGPPPTSYRSPWRSADGAAVADAIVQLSEAYRQARSADGSSMFDEGAPSPHPELQIRPKP